MQPAKHVGTYLLFSLTAVIAAVLSTPLTPPLSETHRADAMAEVILCRTPAEPYGGQKPYSSPVPARGRFLVASRNVKDPRFSETVILLLSADHRGAMGLVINRPSDVRLANTLPDLKALRGRNDIVYFGGPVNRQQMWLLVRAAAAPAESGQVLEDLHVSSSRKTLEQLAAQGSKAEPFRVYAGYAGWSPQQLEREIARGDWQVMQADTGTVFEKDVSTIWQELFRKGSVLWVMTSAPLPI